MFIRRMKLKWVLLHLTDLSWGVTFAVYGCCCWFLFRKWGIIIMEKSSVFFLVSRWIEENNVRASVTGLGSEENTKAMHRLNKVTS